MSGWNSNSKNLFRCQDLKGLACRHVISHLADQSQFLTSRFLREICGAALLIICLTGCNQGYYHTAGIPTGAQALTVPTYTLAQSPSWNQTSAIEWGTSAPPPSQIVSPPVASLSPVPTTNYSPLASTSPAGPVGLPPVAKFSDVPPAGQTPQAPPRSRSSEVAATKPLDNPIPSGLPATPRSAPFGDDPHNHPPIARSSGTDIRSPLPPANRPAPAPIPSVPANAQPMMKETSLAWAPWPFSTIPPGATIPGFSTGKGARSVLPYRAATRPGSSAERHYRTRVSQNQALASAAESDLFVKPATTPLGRPGLKYRGGKTLPELAYVNLYFGGEERWKQGDVLKIDENIKCAMTDERLNSALKPYFPNQKIRTVPLSSHPLMGKNENKISRADIQQTLRSLHAQGYLDDYDLDVTVFNILCPSGVVLSDDDPAVDSTNGLAGYHGSVKADLDTIYYTVVVTSEKRADGTENGIPVFAESWKNVVAMLYHQMQEVRTNPDSEEVLRNPDDPEAEKKLGWTTDAGEEIGDLALKSAADLSEVFQEVPRADGNGTVPVQILDVEVSEPESKAESAPNELPPLNPAELPAVDGAAIPAIPLLEESAIPAMPAAEASIPALPDLGDGLIPAAPPQSAAESSQDELPAISPAPADFPNPFENEAGK